MAKYKLIKKYPGSPKLNTIVKESEYRIYYINLSTGEKYSKDQIENYPEFWEKVVEKDYEILSFYAKNITGKGDDFVDPNYIWYETSKGNNKWSRKGHITAPYNTQEIINHNGYGIHSVKRLSDGEIFTVGDKVRNSLSGGIGVEIFDIILNNNNELLFGLKLTECRQPITYLEKVKQPLFTTEDGVDIYEGDKLSTVLLDTMELYTINGLAGSNTTSSENFKYFSTKEAAEEYILMNKPCLSINDIRFLDPDKYKFVRLKDLVKSRL